MNEETKKPEPGELAGDGLGDGPGEPVGAEAGAPAQAEPAPAEPAGGSGADGTDLLAEARAETAEVTGRLLRLQADFENYRRRVQREREELALFANQKLLLSLLPVLDNLERALGTPVAEGDEKLRQGVELTARSFREILLREGVEAIAAVGQPFDPNLHEAVMTIESAEHPEGTVVAEFQKGYRLGDRVIRPSMVQVSKPAEA